MRCEVKKSMKRNYSIDILKLFFSISVALGHFSEPIISGGLVVNLFFIMSGYFLVNSFESGKYKTAWNYSFQRVKRIYPYYLFAWVVLIAFNNLCEGFNIIRLAKVFLRSLPEIFMLQNIGIFPGGINYPLWQLCCLIVVSHMMFSLMKWDKQVTLNVLCPLLAIGTYTYLANAFGTGAPDYWGVESRFIYVPLVRAAGSLAIGMFANYPIKRCLKYLENSSNKEWSIVISVTGIVMIAVFWVNQDSFASIIPFLILMLCMLYSKSIFSQIFKSTFYSRFDKLSLAFYLNHAFIIKLYEQLSVKFQFGKNNLLYLAMLLIYSILMVFVVDFLMSKCEKM